MCTVHYVEIFWQDCFKTPVQCIMLKIFFYCSILLFTIHHILVVNHVIDMNMLCSVAKVGYGRKPIVAKNDYKVL